MSDHETFGEMSDEQPGSTPDPIDESLARLQGLINEAIAILEHRAAGRG